MKILHSIADWWYTLRVKAIPKKDIELIRRGLYRSYGEPDKPGFVPFRKMNDYIERCYRLRYYSHQGLNTDPLAVSFLSMYNDITGKNIRFPWDFVSDEEFHHDFIPFVQAGILTDGWRYLYWNVTEDADGRQTCHIHNSILMDSDTEEIAYPWTADNDAKVIDALSDPDNWGYWCGEDSLFRNIDFDPWEDMPYAICSIRFKDDNAVADGYTIKLSTDHDGQKDDDIFYYCNGLEALKSLMQEDNGEDFVVLSYELCNEPAQ